jgi:hypothetical protein
MIKLYSLFLLIIFAITWKNLFNPQNNTSITDLPHVVSHERFPASATPIELEGELFAIIDDIKPSKNPIRYYLRSDDGHEQEVFFNKEVSKEFFGKKVSYRFSQKGEMELSSLDEPSKRKLPHVEAMPLKPNLVKTYKEVVLLFKFNNSTQTYVTSNQVYDQIYNGAYNSYFHDISDGRINHTGDVYGWYQLNRNGAMTGLSFDCEIRNHEIKEMAGHFNIDLTQYDNVITVSNCSEYHTVGGRALLHPYDFLQIGRAQTYIKMAAHPPLLVMNANPDMPHGWGGMIPILVHERAHNFGILHANALDCGDSEVLHPCEHIEYGNRFDRLGSPDGGNYINAHLQKIGQFKSDKDFLHIKENSSFVLDQINSKKKNRKIAAYIYKKDSNQPVFMVESRKPVGFDGKLQNWLFRYVPNGVLVYSALGTSTPTQSPSWGTNFRIIDTKPTDLDWHADTAYESMDGSYFDPITGIGIHVTYVMADGMGLYVDYNDDLKECEITQLKDWISSPYLRLYYEPTPIDNSVINVKKQSRPTSGSSSNTNLPRFSKIVKGGHIALKPGDYFHLRVDTVASEPMMCPRFSFEINAELSAEFLSYSASSGNSGGGIGGGVDLGDLSSDGGNTTNLGKTSLIVYPPLTLSQFRRFARNSNETYEYPLQKIPATALGKNYLIRFRYQDGVNTIYRSFRLYITADGKLPRKLIFEQQNSIKN